MHGLPQRSHTRTPPPPTAAAGPAFPTRRAPSLLPSPTFILILVLILPTLASCSLAQSATFPTLSIPCTSSADCAPRHPHLFCHPSLGTCAARTCGVVQGLACSLFNSTTYCTSPAGEGTCSPRLAHGKVCNPALDVQPGQLPSISGLVPGDAWVVQANAQCEVGYYCHQHLRMCVGADTDPEQRPVVRIQVNSQEGTGMLGSVGGVLAVLAMAVFVCGCCALSCGRMCGWQPGEKGGMRWGRMCCGFPGAVARCVGWMCGRRKAGRVGKNEAKVGEAHKPLEQQQPGSIAVESVPMQPARQPVPASAASAASLSASSSSLVVPPPGHAQQQYYDATKQQVAAHHLAQPQPALLQQQPFPPAAAAAALPAHGQYFDPRKQQVAAHLQQQPSQLAHFSAHQHMPPPSISSSSSHSNPQHAYTQPIHSGSPINHFDPRKQAAATAPPPPPPHHQGGGYVMATAPPPASSHIYPPPGVPASAAQMQLGKHELGMVMGQPTREYYGAHMPQAQGQHVYVASAGASASASHQQQPQVYYAAAGSPPVHVPPKSG